MPNRILRQGILTSPRIARLGWAEEVFYRRLHSVVDDFGRYYADEGLLRAACYPRQLNKVSDPDIGKWLRACVDAALVRVYPAEDGERYLEVLDFGQQVRAKKSAFPNPMSTCVADAAHTPAVAHLDVSVGEGVSVDSEANASDGEPSVDNPEGEDPGCDPPADAIPSPPAAKRVLSAEEREKADVWRSAVDVLQAGGCKSEAMCRTFMGKLVKDYGLPVVKEAVTAAVMAAPAEAREYLKATCQRLKGERRDPVTVPSDAADRTADYLAQQQAHAAAAQSPEAEAARIAALAALGVRRPQPQPQESV